MDLVNRKVKLENCRVIGLKNTDMERLAAASRESSFDATEAVVVPEPVIESAPVVEAQAPVVEPNIFDQSVSSEPMVEPQPVFETPENIDPVMETPVTSADVFVAPQFDAPEHNIPAPEVNSEHVEETPVMNEDPAMILATNLIKLIEDKNNMINALNTKVDLLTDQLRESEEARKVMEAQKVAAETTLAEARRAETADGGPTLVYQNGQAA